MTANHRVQSRIRALRESAEVNTPHFYNNPAFEGDVASSNVQNVSFRTDEFNYPGANQGAEAEQRQAARFFMERMAGSEASIMRRTVIFNLALYLFLAMHLFVMAYTDPYSSSHLRAQVFLFCGQFALLIIVCVTFFFSTSQIPIVFMGRYDLYMKRFKYFYITLFFHFVFFVANKSLQIKEFYSYRPYLSLWDSPGYLALWILERLFLIAFWCAAVRGSLSVMNFRF
mmetsp:Transcript_1847/g.2703  ORF Transcript_1847/g.2703 Transcript_1847/m.2703 type:complete len:228 (+) Transcript_1847:253-936(+)